MTARYVTKSEFARECLVHPASINQAIKQGRVRVSRNGKINPSNAINIQYKEKAHERKRKTAKGRSELKKLAERQSLDRKKILDFNGSSAPDTTFENFQPPPQSQIPSVYDESEKTEIDYAIEKMRSTTALNKARLAEMVRATIRRDFVDTVISLIGTSISDHLITMGDRLSSDIAAIAGSTEASVIRKIKEEIDADITAAIVEMKTVIERRYKESLEQ